MSQPQRILTPNGLEVPPDFPYEAYDAIYSRTHPNSQEAFDVALRSEFGRAWNAVAHRFIAAAHYSDSFKEAALRDGIGTTPAIQHVEERALFGFFANAISSFDAAHYGLYVIGAFLSPLYFCLIGLGQQQKADRASTRHAYQKHFPGDPIVSALNEVRTNAAFNRLRETRNVLAHRALLPRRYRMKVGSGASQQPTEWLPGITLTENLLTPYRADLARLLGQVLDATGAFVFQHF